MFSESPCLTKMSARTPPELLYFPIDMIAGGEPAHLSSCDLGFQNYVCKYYLYCKNLFQRVYARMSSNIPDVIRTRK